jgi:peptidoglycan/xylan/chitin deacetylase (PgdA/CDA1 family)
LFHFEPVTPTATARRKKEYLRDAACYLVVMFRANLQHRRVMGAIAGILALCLASAVSAGGWPQPAAGHSASKGPELILTFDDGPNPRTTPLVLDTLKAHHLHAVFFIVGEMVENNKKGLALIKRIQAEGHVIANHTQTHQDLFRAPYGARCKRLEDMLAQRHVSHFHWDLDPQEWKHGSADKAFDYVTGEVQHSSDRNVLLMHDIKEATVLSLPRILDWIDRENVGRKAIGKKPIVIFPAPMLAAEKMPKGLWKWLGDTAEAADVRNWAASVLP